jgi:hypothetical protein
VKPGRPTGGRINGLRGGGTNGLPAGRINGLRNGKVNGLPNGRINGLRNGKVNGLANGRINGLRNGKVNGLGNGRINGLRNGKVNGLANGRTNGLRNGGVLGFTNGLNGNGRGRTNGLRNGKVNGLNNGKINGLRNGKINGLSNGRTNGNGHSNGFTNGRKSGLINGNGFINGFRLSSAPNVVPLTKRNPSMRIAMVFAIVAIVIILPFLLIYSMPSDQIKIDGYFFDWDRAGYYQEAAGAVSPGIDIRQYSVVTQGGTVYGYIATSSAMFSQPDGTPSSFFVFFEMDNNPSTGYIIDGIGADTMVEITGWNGSIVPSSCGVYDFSRSADRNDYLGFGSGRNISIIGSENKLEFSFPRFDSGNPTVRFFAKDGAGSEDLSDYSIKQGDAALRVEVNRTMNEVLTVGPEQTVMTLELSSVGGNAMINQFNFTQLGNATGYSVSIYDGSVPLVKADGAIVSLTEPLEVREGYGRLLTAMVEADAGQIGNSFGLGLSAGGVETHDCTVTVDDTQYGAKVAYIGTLPSGIVIDGAFADWANGYVVADRSGDVQLPNGSYEPHASIDIQEYGMHVDAKDVAMYLSVKDYMMNGTILPKDIRLPVPSTGLPNLTSVEMLGTDIAGAVIDSDWNTSTGANVNGAVGADYLVLITGKKGRVVLSEIYSWNPAGNGSWDYLDSVRAAVDRRHMEFAFNLSDLPLGDNDIAAVGFFMTDWRQGTDFSDGIMPLGKWQIGTYMKAFGGIMINEVLNRMKPPGGSDFIELFNSGTQPITVTGWTIYDGTTRIYTFGTLTINPGQFYVVSGLTISKTGNLRLQDQSGTIIDSVSAKEDSNGKSTGRIGSAPWATWKQNMVPSPGAINPGQMIPEFSDFLVPVLFVLTTVFFLKWRRRRAEQNA